MHTGEISRPRQALALVLFLAISFGVAVWGALVIILALDVAVLLTMMRF